MIEEVRRLIDENQLDEALSCVITISRKLKYPKHVEVQNHDSTSIATIDRGRH